MAISENPTSTPRQQQPASFATRLAKFAGRLIGTALVGAALIVISTLTEGVLHWVTLVLGVVVLVGLALYSHALSAETQRKLGPLPLGRDGEDLTSMPLYQGRHLLDAAPQPDPPQRAS